VEASAWFGLVCIEGVGVLSAVLELAEHKLPIANKDRTGCIPIIGGLSRGKSHLMEHIVHENWSL